jgi:schlafen family protein
MIRDWEAVERHVQGRIPETPALEYKQELHLDPRSQRREVLKDITGMGNGGGGLVVYGIAETADGDGVPSETTPLTDQRLIGRLEDIIRSGVSPPLLYELSTIDAPAGGYVLVIDVQRSPLGPYMVQSRGDFGYYRRHGTRTGPMSETEVRDAYSLAARQIEQRGALWDDFGLPARPGSLGPWLIVSAVPREPLVDHLDPTTTDASAFALPDDLRPRLHFELAGIIGLASSLRLWADGFYAERQRHDGITASQRYTWPRRRTPELASCSLSSTRTD